MPSYVTAFFQDKIIASGEREQVTRTIEDGYPASDFAEIHIFDDATGARSDLDYWDAARGQPEPRGRGRPKLGVAAREVTLLPRHWEWLQKQKGGASAALRRLVDEAMKAPASAEARRDAAYRFLTATSGDRPGYEEAIRALYRGEEGRLREIVTDWPADIRSYLTRLLGSA